MDSARSLSTHLSLYTVVKIPSYNGRRLSLIESLLPICQSPLFVCCFRLKAGGVQTESVLISQLQHGLALEFERSDAARKLRLLLSELLFIMSQVIVHSDIHLKLFVDSMN